MSRVAFVGYSYGVDPRLIGGHQSILRRLARYLTGRGHAVDFLVFGEPAAPPQRLAADTTLYTFPTFATAAQRLQHERYAYVQLSYLPLATYPAAMRYLASQRNRSDRPRLGYLYVVWPDKVVMRLARILLFKLFYDRVIAVSPRLQRQLNRYRVPSFTLLPPVPDDFFEPVARVAGPPRVAYMGRVDDDKGVQHILALLRGLKAAHPDLAAEISGYYYPHSAASLALHRELQAQDVIHYLGGSYHDYDPAMEQRVLNQLRHTDLLLLPYERLSGITVDVPLLLLEAMATGCTVLTTQVADLPEIVAQPALTVPHPAAMQAAAEALIAQRGWGATGERLQARAQELGVALSVAGPRYEREVGLA